MIRSRCRSSRNRTRRLLEHAVPLDIDLAVCEFTRMSLIVGSASSGSSGPSPAPRPSARRSDRVELLSPHRAAFLGEDLRDQPWTPRGAVRRAVTLSMTARLSRSSSARAAGSSAPDRASSGIVSDGSPPAAPAALPAGRGRDRNHPRLLGFVRACELLEHLLILLCSARPADRQGGKVSAMRTASLETALFRADPDATDDSGLPRSTAARAARGSSGSQQANGRSSSFVGLALRRRGEGRLPFAVDDDVDLQSGMLGGEEVDQAPAVADRRHRQCR